MKKQANEPNLIDLTEIEMTRAEGRSSADVNLPVTTFALIQPKNPQALAAEMYRLRVQESNYRKAEGLGMIGDSDPIQKLRTSLARGNFKEAAEHFQDKTGQQSTKKQSESSSDFVNQEKNPAPAFQEGEWFLEQLRFAAFARQWIEVLALCQNELPDSLMPLTRISILQILALAHYELGEFGSALQVLKSIQSLATLYPLAQSAFYARILQAKVLASTGDFFQSTQIREELWLIQRSQKGQGLNGFLTLLRLEASLKRIKGETAVAEVLAAIKICQLMGDGYYESLGHFELLLSVSGSESFELSAQEDATKTTALKSESSLIALCSQGIKTYPGLNCLWQEVKNGMKTSSARELIQQMKTSHQDLEKDLLRAYQAESIVFLNEGSILNLVSGKFIKANPLSQPWLAMRFIANRANNHGSNRQKNSGVSKETLFTYLYPQLQYNKLKHDALLFQLARRIRQKLDIALILNDGLFSFASTLFVH